MTTRPDAVDGDGMVFASSRSLAFALFLSSTCGALSFVGGCSATPDPTTAPVASSTPSLTRRVVGPAKEIMLPTQVTPTRYRVALEIDPRKTTFSGHTEIDVAVKEATDVLVIHGRDLQVSKALVRQGGRDVEAVVTSRLSFGGSGSNDELVLVLPSRLEAGKPATLVFDYAAPFAQLWGLYRSEARGRSYAFTQFEPIDARRAFPCFDEPRYKTPFEIEIVAPTGNEAFSNTKETSAVPRDGGMTKHVYAPTEPLPTYLIAFAVGDFEVSVAESFSPLLQVIAVEGTPSPREEALEVSMRTTAWLAKYFDIPYAYDKLSLVAVPDFGVGGMENAGLITFREDALLTGPLSSTAARRRQRGILAHEIAHQWFGNYVTMGWWDDLWLNEGFATWMTPKAMDAVVGTTDARDMRVFEKSSALNADALPDAESVRKRVTTAEQIKSAGGWTAYAKSGSVLTMIEHWIGEETFQKAISGYMKANPHGTVTAEKLFAKLDEVSRLPVSRVAKGFLDQAGAPLFRVELDCGAKGAEVTIEPIDVGSVRPFETPVCLRTSTTAVESCSLVKERTVTSVASCPDVFYPNAAEAGYYRFELAPNAKAKLLATVSKLPSVERAGAILNAWALVLSDRAHVDEIFTLLDAMKLETEKTRVVLEAAIVVLREIDRTLVTDETRASFAKRVQRYLSPTSKRLAIAKNLDEPGRLIRFSVLQTLHEIARDGEVAKSLEREANAFLATPRTSDPDLGALAIRISSSAGGVGRTKVSVASLDSPTLVAADRVTLTMALGARSDPAGLREVLDAYADGRVRAGDLRYLRSEALQRPESRAVFYAFMRERFDDVVKRFGAAGPFVSALGSSCDEAEVASLTQFFAPKLDALEGAKRAFQEAHATASRCIAVKTRETASLRKALGLK